MHLILINLMIQDVVQDMIGLYVKEEGQINIFFIMKQKDIKMKMIFDNGITLISKIVEDNETIIRQEVDKMIKEFFKKQHELVIIIDCSGSMYNISKDMAGAFNKFIEEQKKIKGECLVTLVEFSDKHKLVFKQKPIKEIPTDYILEARGSTALFDAINYTFSLLDNSPKTCMIITDGGENASTEIKDKNIILNMISDKKAAGWEIIYLGADHNVFEEGTKIGIDNNTIGVYNTNSVSVSNAFGVIHRKFSALRNMESDNMSFTTTDQGDMVSENYIDWNINVT